MLCFVLSVQFNSHFQSDTSYCYYSCHDRYVTVAPEVTELNSAYGNITQRLDTQNCFVFL
jgi:hypothetical protein